MPLLSDFPSPPVAVESFAGGFSSKGAALLTLDELEMYSSGKGARRERLYKCPFCGAGERAFHLNIETGAFNCKRGSCGVKGRLREFWPPLPDATSPRFVSKRARPSAFTLTPEVPKAALDQTGGNWRALWESALALDDGGAQPGRDYVKGRGVALFVALDAGARFCRNWAPSTEGKPYAGGAAILFPLLDRSGELVAVAGRYLRPSSTGPKARTGGDASRGAFRAPALGADPLDTERPVLVEGPFDALALSTCGAPALAMNGVALPHWLPSAMAFKAPILAPDDDAGGPAALGVWRRDIGPFAPRLRALVPEGGKDFGESIGMGGAAMLRAFLIRSGVLDALDENPIEEEVEASRLRLNRLESLLGNEGACRAIAATAGHIEARNPTFWRRLKAADKTALAVAFALLDAGLLPDETLLKASDTP
jgi:hypothetical protein